MEKAKLKGGEGPVPQKPANIHEPYKKSKTQISIQQTVGDKRDLSLSPQVVSQRLRSSGGMKKAKGDTSVRAVLTASLNVRGH